MIVAELTRINTASGNCVGLHSDKSEENMNYANDLVSMSNYCACNYYNRSRMYFVQPGLC